MKKLTNLILAALILFLASCDESKSGDSLEPVSHPAELLEFYSEEEFIAYVRDFQSVSAEGESRADNHGIANITHYYKLKNLPLGATLSEISLGTTGVNVSTIYYNPQHFSDSGSPERVMIQYSPYYSYNIEENSFWIHKRFPEEAYIREIDGVTYYIRKGDGIAGLLWGAAWVNADGYHMKANFPYRFTADEVLAYVSDLERVEIVG